MAQTDAVISAIAQENECVNWIASKLDGVAVAGDHRHRMPAQLFDIAIEHHAGITQLIDKALYASGFALIRCQFECFIRGAWIHYCASDEQIEAFIANDSLPEHFAKWIEALEQTEQFAGTILSDLKAANWKAMNGYTHGGLHQISRRMQGNLVEGNYDDGEIIEVLRFAGTMALLGLGQIAALADRKDIWDEVDERLKPPA